MCYDENEEICLLVILIDFYIEQKKKNVMTNFNLVVFSIENLHYC